MELTKLVIGLETFCAAFNQALAHFRCPPIKFDLYWGRTDLPGRNTVKNKPQDDDKMFGYFRQNFGLNFTEVR